MIHQREFATQTTAAISFQQLQAGIQNNNELTEEKPALAGENEKHKNYLEYSKIISHEILNPTHAILGSTEILLGCIGELQNLQTELSKPTPNQQSIHHYSKILLDMTDYIKAITQCAQHQKAVVSDIQHHDKKGQTNDANTFEIDELVQSVIDMHKAQLSKKRIEIKKILPTEVLHLVADTTRLKQVIDNLLSNAIKYTFFNGKITIRADYCQLANNTGQLSFDVEDTGCGIEDEMLSCIFKQNDTEVQGQANDSSACLGLTICQRNVESMGGKIQATSKKGLGSNFSFTVNCKQFINSETAQLEIDSSSESSQSTTPPSSPETIPHVTTPRRILYVEDELVNQRIFKRRLENTGHTVVIANNGQEAIDKYKSGDFDLIIMDISMPVMNGLDATKTIRFNDKQVPIIGLSANSSPEDIEAAKRSGMNGYLTKPCHTKDLLDAIDKFSSKNIIPQNIFSTPAKPLSPVSPIKNRVESDLDKPHCFFHFPRQALCSNTETLSTNALPIVDGNHRTLSF